MEHRKKICKIVLISHGELAKGMQNSVQLLLGEQEHLTAYSLHPEHRVDELVALLKKEVRMYGAENLLILSDVQYGSPFNAAVALALEYPQIHHITGMNLAVVLSALSARKEDFPELDLDGICSKIIRETTGSIVNVRRLLAERMQEEVVLPIYVYLVKSQQYPRPALLLNVFF